MARSKIRYINNVLEVKCQDVIDLRPETSATKKECTIIYNVETLEGRKKMEEKILFDGMYIDDHVVETYIDGKQGSEMIFYDSVKCTIIDIIPRGINARPRKIMECYREGE